MLRRTLLPIWLAWLLLLASPPPAGALLAAPSGTARAGEGDTGKLPRDPHAGPCVACHADADPSPGRAALKDADGIAVCLGCHPDDNLHPVMVPAEASCGLPLVTVDGKTQVTCVTCHYLHGRDLRRYLLRGDREAALDRKDFLCGKCHGEALIKRSPHTGTPDSCPLCHMSQPNDAKAAREGLKGDVERRCDLCHGAIEDAHYLAVNPFADIDIVTQTSNIGLPLLNERFSCSSCHDPHGGDPRRKHLRGVYLDLASFSIRINPHWKDVMCITCHEGEPAAGKPALREEGDTNRMCNRCHADRRSGHDIHPVNSLPSSLVKIPADMPLAGGRVTCGTCHASSLQEKGDRAARDLKRKNPAFIRGGFTTREEFCFRCHPREQFRSFNPHNQVDAGGRIREMACLFCHSSLPDRDSTRFRLPDLVEGSSTICLWCHAGETFARHPEEVDHLVKPSREVARLIDSAPARVGLELPLVDGEITCGTCHNPHQEGVLQRAPGDGPPARRPRLTVGREICAACHGER
jgi:predicted CXXCH cytochrome family protein